MGRTESHQAAEQGMQQSAEDQKRAGASYTAANKSLDDYSKSLDSFMRFGRSTYGANGEYARDQNTIATGAAAAGSNKIGGDMALNAMRTGANTANYAPALEESTRAASRDLTEQLATADSDRLSKLTAINQYGVQASALPAQVQSTLYGTGTSGAGSQLSSGADAAKTPGFWDVFAPALASGAGQAAGGFAAKGCWIAAAVYDGWFDPRTVLVRKWLNQEFVKSLRGRMVMAFYLRYGKGVARFLRSHPRAHFPFRWLFNRALTQAQVWRRLHA